MMIVLLAKYRVRPGSIDEVLGALAEMKAYVVADEPGCNLYEVARSIADPNELVLIEHYFNMSAVEEHRTTAHFTRLIEGRIIPLLEARERELFDLLIA